MDPLHEAFWVMGTYGATYASAGLLIALVLVVFGARRKRWLAGVAILLLAVLVLWIALFLSVDSGYRAWQSTSDPPEEAFSDTGGPFFFLFFGWLPSAAFLAPAFLLLSFSFRWAKSSRTGGDRQDRESSASP